MQIVATEPHCREATQKDLVREERGSRDRNSKNGQSDTGGRGKETRRKVKECVGTINLKSPDKPKEGG
jgi:hypothetical protein